MGDTWHDETHVSSHREERKKKDLLGVWYKERISESGGGNRWRKTKIRKKRKRDGEGEEREREEGKEKRSEFLLSIDIPTVGVCQDES